MGTQVNEFNPTRERVPYAGEFKLEAVRLREQGEDVMGSTAAISSFQQSSPW